MSFFDSEFVQKEMQDITALQEKIYESVFKFHNMSNEDKLEHINILEELLQKQKILYTRLSLSDDPKAKLMKENIMKEATMIGFPADVDLSTVFSNMNSMIANMRKTIEREG
jgi:hypothetical protein|tara:strand:+ start:492 stop:827 length:336 start_codon:yes stop_codon:yes gene_type:complete